MRTPVASEARLKLFDLTMIVTGLVIGMGIFRTPRDAASAALSPSIYFSAWIVGGIIAICGALTYAEIGSRYPITGAYFRIFSFAYHPSLAFALNCSILVSNAASVGAIALIGAGYILPAILGEVTPAWSQLMAICCIILFFLINLAGLRLSARTQNILMVIKIIMLMLVMSSLFVPSIHHKNNVPLLEPMVGSWQEILRSFGLCLVAVSFTYGGYQQAINFGSEVELAPRNLPRGIISGITIIIVLYVLTNFAYYQVVGFQDLKSKNEIASVVVSSMFGDMGGRIFAVFLFLSVLAYVNVNLLSNPRVIFAMSEDGVLPAIFQKRSQRKGVYTLALTVFAAMAVIVVFFAETFERVLSFIIFLDCFGMATSAATIFILRKRTKALDSSVYKMKLFPLMPLVFICGYVFVGLVIAVQTPAIALTGMAVLIGSGILYFVIKRKK